uniref:Uncharacterized protein n=1 Tax=Arion vulgaris TaxID=1028688 RepID=A0A0B6ZQ73_9EUPU
MDKRKTNKEEKIVTEKQEGNTHCKRIRSKITNKDQVQHEIKSIKNDRFTELKCYLYK